MPDEDGRSLYGPWARRNVRWGMPFGTAPLGADGKVPSSFLPPFGGGGSGLPDATTVTGDFVAGPGAFYACDTSAGSFTATLDPEAEIGDLVMFEDPLDTWKVNPLTITAGEVTIDGETEQVCDAAERFVLVRTADGWRTKEAVTLFPFLP